MMHKFLLIVSVIFLSLFFSCKKNQAGGNSEIIGKVKHHERIIPFARVFIKFNAKDFPGTDTTLYDVRIHTGADAGYDFKCYKGDYFLYGLGFDQGRLEPVSGGTHVKMRHNETSEVDVPVAE